MYCIYCGKEIKNDSRFCPECGRKLTGTEGSTDGQGNLENPQPPQSQMGPAVIPTQPMQSRQEVLQQIPAPAQYQVPPQMNQPSQPGMQPQMNQPGMPSYMQPVNQPVMPGQPGEQSIVFQKPPLSQQYPMPPQRQIMNEAGYSDKKIKRTPEFVLGLIGGLLGLSASVSVIFFREILGIFGIAKSGFGSLGIAALIFSAFGIFGAIFVHKSGKLAGLIMLTAAAGGLISVWAAYLVPGILLLSAGIISLRKPNQKLKKFKWYLWSPITITISAAILAITFIFAKNSVETASANGSTYQSGDRDTDTGATVQAEEGTDSAASDNSSLSPDISTTPLPVDPDYPLTYLKVFKNSGQEDLFKNLVLDDYQLYVDTCQTVTSFEDIDSFGAEVTVGSMSETEPTQHCIVMITDDGRIWTAVTVGDNLKYYTNTEQTDKLPITIDFWRATFENKEVLYMNNDQTGAETAENDIASDNAPETAENDTTADNAPEATEAVTPEASVENPDETGDTDNPSEEEASEEASDESTDMAASDVEGTGSSYYYSEYYSTIEDDLMFSPQEVYYEDGKMTAVMYVYNGKDVPVYDITDVEIIIGNGTDTYADGYFSSMDGATIEPDNYITWTFEFNEDCVYLQNADLSYLETTAYFTYSY